VKKCQIFKYLVNRTRKKHYLLTDSYESEPELDFSYKDNLNSIIYHNSRSRICKNKESLRYCVSPNSRNSQLLRLNSSESGILLTFRGTTNISHSSTMISTNPASNFTTQTEMANLQLRQNVNNMLVKGCQHGGNSIFITWRESPSSASEHTRRIKSNTLLHDLYILWPTHHSHMLFNSSCTKYNSTAPLCMKHASCMCTHYTPLCNTDSAHDINPHSPTDSYGSLCHSTGTRNSSVPSKAPTLTEPTLQTHHIQPAARTHKPIHSIHNISPYVQVHCPPKLIQSAVCTLQLHTCSTRSPNRCLSAGTSISPFVQVHCPPKFIQSAVCTLQLHTCSTRSPNRCLSAGTSISPYVQVYCPPKFIQSAV
jgi:hypothetical protein